MQKKRKSTVSGLIKELIIEESKKMRLKASKKGLGTYLSELPIKKIPDFKSDKELFEKLKEEKHLNKT